MTQRRYATSARTAALAVLAAFIAVASASAQVTTGTLIGHITDATGQPLFKAAVRVEDAAHGVSRTASTDELGFYRFSDLPPAMYAVQAEMSGFQRLNRSNIAVAVDSTVRVDLQLALGTLTSTVDVTATATPAQTTSGGLGTVVSRQRIDTLPLNRRDFFQLALLSPGASSPVDGSELSSRGGFAMHANGAREESNDFLLDGVDNNDPYVNRYVVQPSIDSVEEFKVATNSYSAEYGRNAGGQINIVTRRGTNDLHGFGYEYFRNDALDAANYFAEGDTEPFSRNQFGGGIGGPLRTDRTFFFGAVDALRQRQTLSRQGIVPTFEQRGGNLAGMATAIDPFTGAPFANNRIPDGRISQVARRVLALFPEANRAGSPNYLGQPVQREDQTQANVRVDHRIATSDQLLFRYSDGQSELLAPYTEGTGVTAGFGEIATDRTWNFTGQHQRMFGNNANNSLRFAVHGFSRDVLTENHETNVGAAWNVNWLNVPAEAQGYPIIDVAGFSRIGDAFSLPLLRDTRTYQIADDFSLARGSHLFKMGAEFRKIALDSQLDLFARGQMSFSGAITGNALADLLLGFPSFGLQAQADNPIHMRTHAFSAYVQDTWQARPSLTLNLGVRYQYDSPPVDEFDGMSAYDPATRSLARVGTNGVSRSGLSADTNNIAPRLGFSWNAAEKTVIRGGYGIYYDSGMLTVNTSQYFNPPQFNLRIFFPTAQGLLTLNDPFPLSRGIVPPPTLSALSPDIVGGYLQHWNGAVQREVPSLGTLTVAYAGSKGSNLIRPRNLNQARPGAGDVQARRPNPAFADIFFVESAGSSRYDSLQLAFDRPLSRRISMLASYTLAQSNDDASAFLGTPSDKNLPQDSTNPDAEWGPSNYDIRHRFTLAYIIQLPQEHAWTRNTQIQGITTLHSGQPFTPLLRFDNSNTGNVGGSTAGSDRPNVSGETSLDNPSPDEWFNTAAFSVPARYTFGNAGRNSLRGPGYASFDLAVSRRIPFGTQAVTLEFQVFNLFDRANFDLPEHNADEPATFGRIFSAKAPRELQLTARFTF